MAEKFPWSEGADAAVLKAYGWPTDLSEPEIVSRLFDMYAKLTEGDFEHPQKSFSTNTDGHRINLGLIIFL